MRDRFDSESDAERSDAAVKRSSTNVVRRRTTVMGDESVPAKRLEGMPNKARQDKVVKNTPKEKTRMQSHKRSTLRSRLIPKSVKDCDEADTMLLEWKDAGKTWEQIKEQWLELTGEQVAKSSLPNRYQRLKDNFCVLSPEDLQCMLVAKQKIEKNFETEKWNNIAAEMLEQGVDGDLNPKALQRMYKRTMIEAGAVLPEGVSDADMQVDDE
ncbi:hypothetical protein AMS68_006546 [Peltaster fructicola]|uniref:Uncharacterized protein n=1 Tax=Peltaster fructicola TaxID=286661 RepID=A0A6H0Y2E5_9PEZI|nr:hypothetical protein AMS68_006546 [Peltaster fructicola]